MDILVAVALFVIVFIVFVGILANITEKQKESRLSKQGESIAAQVSNPENDYAFIQDEKVDEVKLRQVITEYEGENYGSMKDKLNVRDNFCIYLEDADGNLIPLNTESLEDNPNPNYVNGIGSSEAELNDNRCGIIAQP